MVPGNGPKPRPRSRSRRGRQSGWGWLRQRASESIPRWDINQPGWWRLALIVPVLIWLAWQSIAATGPGRTADDDPAGARAAHPEETADSLVRLATKRLDQAATAVDLSEVSRLSVEALVSRPVGAEPLILLALTSERSGDAARAEALMRLAEKRSWRNPVVEGWLFNRMAATGDFGGALVRADALLRSFQSDVGDRVREALARLAADPRAIPPLAKLLAANPPWREWFLSAFLANRSQFDASAALLQALAVAHAPLTPAELSYYLDALVSEDQFERAQFVWLDSLPSDRSREITYVHNGDFAAPLAKSPFDWRFADQNVAEVGVAASPAPATGPALRIEFANRRVSSPLASELLLLPPGDYVLSGYAMTDQLVNERGLWWTLSCADKDKNLPLGFTERMSGSRPWQKFAARFEVPPSCTAQWLRLELAARVRLEQQVSGTAWFGDLTVRRVDRPAEE